MNWDSFVAPPGWVDMVGKSIGTAEDRLYKQIVRAGLKELTRIRICRIPAFFIGNRYNYSIGAFPGHYWIEIINDLNKMDGSEKFIESYGWYPSEDPSVSNLFSPEGCLNGDSVKRRIKDRENIKNNETRGPQEAGRATKNNEYSNYPFDPHHNGDYTIPNSKKGKVNHPYLFADDPRTEDDVIKEIREFAIRYKKNSDGKWSYWLDSFTENNCHTFLFHLLYKTNIADKYILKDLHFQNYFRSAQENRHYIRLPKNIGNIYTIRPSSLPLPYYVNKARKIYAKMDQVKNNALKLAKILK
jgi:hypothetical protein